MRTPGRPPTAPALAPGKVARLNEGTPEIMGVREAAAELGVHSTDISRVTHLPPPFQVLASGPFSRADVIREFAALRRKATGVPSANPPATGLLQSASAIDGWL